MSSGPNKICIIEGDYRLSAPSNCSLAELIDAYKRSEVMAKQQLQHGDLVVLRSKDGSELCANLMQSLTSAACCDFDATLVNVTHNATIMQHANESKAKGPASSSFVCFLVADFDADDCVFVKLEETQSKLASIFSSLMSQCNATVTNNSTVINATLVNQAMSSGGGLSKRFMIFGWPILKHCVENNLVRHFCFIFAQLKLCFFVTSSQVFVTYLSSNRCLRFFQKTQLKLRFFENLKTYFYSYLTIVTE